MSEHLTNLRITGYEAIISEACYNNIVAALCYSTLKICHNDSNEASHICNSNCTDFNLVIENECPHYVNSGFSQLISDSNPCGNLSSPLNCDDIIPGNDFCLCICSITHTMLICVRANCKTVVHAIKVFIIH